MLPIGLNATNQFPGLRGRLPYVVAGQMGSGHVAGKLLGRKEGEEQSPPPSYIIVVVFNIHFSSFVYVVECSDKSIQLLSLSIWE